MVNHILVCISTSPNEKKKLPGVSVLVNVAQPAINETGKDGKTRVDGFSASAIVAVYDGLKNPEHKKTIEKMIETQKGFLKIQAFAFSMTK